MYELDTRQRKKSWNSMGVEPKEQSHIPYDPKLELVFGMC